MKFFDRRVYHRFQGKLKIYVASRRIFDSQCNSRIASSSYALRIFQVLIVGSAFLIALGSFQHLAAEPAHFWLSMSNNSTIGPEAPTIQGVKGIIQTVHIWAQPATLFNREYSPSNPFKRLQNVSLNLVTTGVPAVDFLDDSIVVYNTSTPTPRFQYINDSNSMPRLTSEATETQVLNGAQDEVNRMRGFLLNPFTYVGFGGASCDSFCALTPNGTPAWLVASVAFRTVRASGTTEFFLQIGYDGMNHSNESSASTFVLFGTDSSPVYRAGLPSPQCCGDRDTTLENDTADLVLQAIAPLPGDYNHNGSVDAADYTVWRNSLGQSGAGLAADGTGPSGAPDGMVNEFDYTFWKAHFGDTINTASQLANSSRLSAPETAALAQLSIGLISFVWLRLRKRRTKCETCDNNLWS